MTNTTITVQDFGGTQKAKVLRKISTNTSGDGSWYVVRLISTGEEIRYFISDRD